MFPIIVAATVFTLMIGVLSMFLPPDSLFKFFLICIISAITGFLVMQPSIDASYMESEWYSARQEKIPLQALKSSQGLKGQFEGGFLYIAGSIASKAQFTTYTKTDNGFYKLKSYPARKSLIKEYTDTNQQPQIVKHTIKKKRKFIKDTPEWIKTVFIGSRKLGGKQNKTTRFVFHVPEGSIVKDIDLAL